MRRKTNPVASIQTKLKEELQLARPSPANPALNSPPETVSESITGHEFPDFFRTASDVGGTPAPLTLAFPGRLRNSAPLLLQPHPTSWQSPK